MKVLRFTIYDPGLEPATVVLRDIDLEVSIEEAIQVQEDLPSGFVTHEIFETEEINIKRVTEMAIERMADTAEKDRNAAMLYWWDLAALERVAKGGVVTGTEPAPLSSGEVENVLRQLAKAPESEGKTVLAIAEDYSIVRLLSGKVEIVGKGLTKAY